MITKNLPTPPADLSRFGLMLETLGRIQAVLNHHREPLLAAEVETAIFWLRNYCEPWMCPACGNHLKVPDSDATPRDCPRCGGNRMFPYAYLEAERMNAQIGLMIGGLTYYSKRQNGSVAQKVLREVGDVKLNGSWRPPAQTGVSAVEVERSVSLWKRWRNRIGWGE